MKQPSRPTTAAVWAVLAAFLCLLPAALLALGFALPAQYGETFLGEMKYKMERLRSAGGRRIVFVGGSGVPFGLKSALAEACLPGYQVVDFGMYAGMGTVVMLDWARSEAREGDIFVVIPEQSPQTLSSFFSGEEVWQASDGAFHLIPLISPKRYEALAAAFPAFAGKKLGYALSGPPEPDGVYARASFDEYGDIACPGREANVLPGGFDPNTPISFSEEVISGDFIDELNEFARAVTARGAKVLYHFPPMNAAALAPGAAPPDVDAYYDVLRTKLLFPILGDPHRCIMDSGWFFDSNFHLNDSGATVFTKLLVEDLKVYLKDTSPTDIALPAMPPPAASALAGDDSCAHLFTYRREGEGWVLEGLTEAGRAAGRLVLPGSYRGAPVTGMSETLLAGNTAVREVVIQPNIGILYDGMFRGCTALERLVLTGERPSAYAVGSALMEGAEFLIYVPESAVDGYRQSYFWQTYDSYLLPNPD